MTMEAAFRQACQAVADDRFSGRFDRGFASLAFQLAFPDRALTDDQADEAIGIDKKGDLEADGIYIDPEGQDICIYQSKSSASLDETALHGFITKFLDAPARLCSSEWLKKANPEVQALADEMRLKLDAGYSIRAVFATASPVSATVRSTFPREREFALPAGRAHGDVLILDIADLTDRYKKLLLNEQGDPTDVTFNLSPGQWHQPADQSVVYITIPAAHFTGVCKPHEKELFRYNPRLYLGSNKVNKKIAATLQDPERRRRFHLLNNGITAVSRGVVWSDDHSELRVRDFQIVNGCQTSTTLFRNQSAYQADENCLVHVKIITTSDEDLRAEISDATNTQTAIGVEDSVSNAPEQDHIAGLFQRHAPPYFYGSKRGAWERLPVSQTGQLQYLDPNRTSGKFRKVTSKELASIALAVLGEPESAKDRPRMVFEMSEGEQSEWYRRIFTADNTASQWLLPVEMHRQANAYLNSLDEESTPARIGKYGRYRLLWLSYDYLRQRYGGDDGRFLSARASSRLLASCGEWAPQVLAMANDALTMAFETAQEADKTTGLREFFRDPAHRQVCTRSFERTLPQWTNLASRAKVDLPTYLNLPTL